MPIAPADIGTELPVATLDWDETDAILYALGVGARPPAELTLLNEGGELAILPTFALVANWWAAKELGSVVHNGGLPMVHAFQSLELTRPLSPRGQVEVKARITAVQEKGSNTLVELTSKGHDKAGPLFTAASGTMILGMHGWGGTSGPSADVAKEPEGRLSASVADYVRPEQASIYRLCGDRNALHIDPKAARAAGFKDVFLHGLCTLGFAARALINGVGNHEAATLQSISCRFSSPVGLDQPIRTDIWELDAHEFAFQTSQADRLVLSRGRAVLRHS